MHRLLSSVSRVALVATVATLFAPAAFAEPITIDGTETSTVYVNGDDVLTVTASGVINAADNDGVIWDGASSGDGVVIDNYGTITTQLEDGRAIDTSGGAGTTPRSIAIYNREDASIRGGDDGIRINANYAGAYVTVENWGEISTNSGQALDFAQLEDATINIINHGRMTSVEGDALRPGKGAVVINHGHIESGSAGDSSLDGDGIDFQDFGGQVINTSTGVIIGAKHGITGDVTEYVEGMEVDNAAGGQIIGRNGSGINIDSEGDEGFPGTVLVRNWGLISGQANAPVLDENSHLTGEDEPDGIPDSDGDGSDVDSRLVLHNWGTVEGTGASGTNDGTWNTADGIAAGGGEIYNYAGGVIRAYDSVKKTHADDESSDLGRAILIDDSNGEGSPYATSVYNAGLITSDGVVITFVGEHDDIIDNEGTISRATREGAVLDDELAVDMGGGDDTFFYRAGSTVYGTVEGGDHIEGDRLVLVGGYDSVELTQFSGFEVLRSESGSHFFASGDNDDVELVEVAGRLTYEGAMINAGVGVKDGGVLAGDATFASLVVEGGGTVSPGNGGLGTLVATGDLVFEDGSFYDVEIDYLNSDRIVADAAYLNDDAATVRLTALTGPLRDGADYIIVSADGIDGRFNPVVEHDLLFLDASLSGVGGDVVLSLDRNALDFSDVAITRNQWAVGDALDRADTGAPLVEHLLSATDASEVRASYDLLSGEVHASLGTVLFGQTTLVADALVGRMRQTAAGSSAALAALGFGGPTAYATKAAEPAPFNTFKAPVAAPGPVYALWGQGFGQWTNASGNGNTADLDASLGGFLIGGDVTTNNVTFGIAGGYSSADTDVDGRRSSADANTAIFAAYAAVNLDAFRLRAGGSYGWTSIDTSRTTVVGNVIENPTASYDGSTVNLFAEAAYAFETGGIALEPFAQIGWSRVETDGFIERNAPLTGLVSSGLSFDTPYSTLGARVATTFEAAGSTVTPHASLGWRHAFGDVMPEVAMAFIDTGTGFATAGTPIAEDSLVVGAGLEIGFGANLSLNIGYEGQFADEIDYNAVKGGLTYRF